MVGVQQMVGLFAQRSFQEFPVQRLHVLVPVGEPHLGTLVDAPQDIAAICRQLLPVVGEAQKLPHGVVVEAGQLARDVDLPYLISVLVILQGQKGPPV